MGGMREVNSDGQIDQLWDLRFEMKSGGSFRRARKWGISENEMPRARSEIPKEETPIKYGGAAREFGIDAIVKHGAFTREDHWWGKEQTRIERSSVRITDADVWIYGK